MKFARCLFPVVMLVTGLVSTNAYAQIDRRREQESTFERRKEETDEMPVRPFVQSKENIDVKQKAENLEISGDVRFEWRHLNEEGKRILATEDDRFYQRYMWLRGHDAIDSRFFPVSQNDWDAEFNLKIKYTYGKSWAAAHLQFDNPAGVRGFKDCSFNENILKRKGRSKSTSGFSSPLVSETFVSYSDYSSYFSENGTSSSSAVEGITVLRDMRGSCKGSGEGNFINLKRAYMGYNVWADGVHRFDIELGRRKLNDVFDSEIQFSSRFDGIIFKFASAIDKVAEWYWNAAAFIIDERVNHIGYAAEVGLLDVLDTGLDIKYSYIDWTKRGKNRCFIRNAIGTEFRISQFTLDYIIEPEFCGKKIPVEFYGAFLINHAAKKTVFTHYKKKNLGGYAGVLIGEVNKQGDWSIDITYEYVQAQMASECDVDGIGRGNILDERLTDIVILPGSDNEVIFPRRGNTNFKGWSFEVFYALTDNLTFDLIYEFTHAEDSKIGGYHYYSNAEIEAIYAF